MRRIDIPVGEIGRHFQTFSETDEGLWGDDVFLCGSTLSMNALLLEKIAYIAVYPWTDQLRREFCHPSKAVKISLKLACLDIHALRFI